MMGMLGWFGGPEAGEDMARAVARPLNAAKIDAYVADFRQSVKDAAAWARAYSAFVADATLTAQESIAVAHQFCGGLKPKTKKAALTAIGQERMRVAHGKSKGESAAKTRLW